jgi:hypothetical protein
MLQNPPLNIPKSNMPKIHLFITVFLTDTPITPDGYYGKSISPSQNKVDQFLTTIHSMQKLQFSSQDIYISFGPEYEWAKEQVMNFVTSCFPFAILRGERLESFSSWQSASMLIPKDVELVLLNSNHDHAFIPTSVDSFEQFAREVLGFGKRFIGEITHWPEFFGQRGNTWSSGAVGANKACISVTSHAVGTCLISREFFQEWWKVDFTNGKKIVRPDNPFGPWVQFEPCTRIVPREEFFRHLDGYGHARVKAPIASPLRACCSLDNKSVVHRDWTRGRFLLGGNLSDLPITPVKGSTNPFSGNLELILLSSAFRVNFLGIYNLVKGRNFLITLVNLTLLPLLLINPYFNMKLFNLILPLPEGNIRLYNLRVLIAERYAKFQITHAFLPPTLKGLVARIIGK